MPVPTGPCSDAEQPKRGFELGCIEESKYCQSLQAETMEELPPLLAANGAEVINLVDAPPTDAEIVAWQNQIMWVPLRCACCVALCTLTQTALRPCAGCIGASLK